MSINPDEILAEIFEKSFDGLIVLGRDGEVLLVNPAMLRMLGYSRKDIEPQGQILERLLPDPGEREKCLASWKEDVSLAVPPERLVQMTCADGTRRWFRFRISHLNNGSQLVNAYDTTERRQAEIALMESEETLRALAEQSPNMIFVNQGGRVVYANRKCEEIMGYTKKEFCAPDFDYMSLIAPEYREVTRQNWRKHATGQEVGSYEYEILTKQGARIPAVITTKLIPYHGERALLGIVTDISQMKQVERELHKLAAKLRQQKKALQNKNTALEEILRQIETEKLHLRQQIAANAEKLILPVVGRLKRQARPADRQSLELLEKNVKQLASRFGVELAGSPTQLSPRETEICNMIKGGLSSKEIAEILHVSLRTIDTHRNRIRRKLGLTSRGINLSSHLQSLG